MEQKGHIAEKDAGQVILCRHQQKTQVLLKKNKAFKI
jgi:hypothetical protein